MTRHFDRIDINTNGTRESLKLWVRALRSETRSLLIGEWIEPAAQANAVTQSIEAQEASVAGIATISADDSEPSRRVIQLT